MDQYSQITAVEASAGSGKTYSLAKHYVKLLIRDCKDHGPQAFTGILAITFTNKASCEMKQRILKMLKALETDSFKDAAERTELLSYWGVDVASAKKMSMAFLDAIISNYSYFQVRTIDSFINNVIMACSFDLDLPAHFEIEHDYKTYLSMALDLLIDDADHDVSVRGKFTAFLDRMLNVEQKINWYPRKDILETVTGLYNDAATHGGTFRTSGVSSGLIHIKRKEFKKLISELEKQMPEGTHANLKKGIQKAVETASLSGFDVGKLSKYFQNDEYKVTAKHDVPLETEKLWKKIRQVLKEICEAESFTQFDTYIDIYNLMLSKFKELANRNRVLFLPELNRIASSVFEEAGMHVPEIYFRLASRIRHYLLDEFQDTNDLQWNNFKLMIDEALSSGGSFFYVGDKKQSIYRFRGANSGLFDRAKDEFSGYEPSEEELDANWRSAPQIVEFNNRMFAKESLDRFLDPFVSDVPGLRTAVLNVFHSTRQKAMRTDISGSVRVEHVDDGEEDAEDIIMARTVEEVKKLSLIRGASNVCILCRDNSDVENISARLIEEGIAVQSEKTLNIKENPIIKELVSLLGFLDSPIDDTAFASFISGRMFGMSSGIDPQKVSKFLFDASEERAKGKTPLYKLFRSRFSDQWDSYLDHLMSTAGFVPLYEYVVRIMIKYAVAEHFPEDHAYFTKLLDLINENDDRTRTIADFLEFFENAQENVHISAAGADAVKVMTIHKSKGLEFDAVVIPFLKMEPKIGGPRKRSYVVVKDGKDLGLVRLKETYTHYSGTLKRIFDEEYTKAFCDELNNIYVALTRAALELIVFVPPKAGRARNIVRELVTPAMSSSNDGPRSVPGLSEKLIKVELKGLGDPISLIKGDDFSQKAVSGRINRVLGSVAHYLLSRVSDSGHPLTDEAVNSAEKLFPYADIKLPVRWVKDLLADKSIGIFFDPADTSYTEKEIVNSKGEMNRIDRLIVKKDEVWVVDFKSSEEGRKDHRAQIKRYESALKQIFNRSVVRGFLVYFDTCSFEEVNE